MTEQTALAVEARVIDALRVNLRGLLERKEWSIRAAARQAGIDQAALTRFLNGKSNNLYLASLARLAEAGDCRMADLLGESETIAPDLIDDTGRNPRSVIDPQGVAELADSIGQSGLLQNLLVEPAPDRPGRYRLIAGHRRLAAIRLMVEDGRWPKGAGVPCQVRTPAADADRLILSLVENINRQDLPPLDEARAFVQLCAMGVSTKQIAEQVGRTRRYVQQRLQLNSDLTPKARKALAAGEIDIKRARELVKAKPKQQDELVGAIKRGAAHLATADNVRRRIMETYVPVTHAFFDVGAYGGEIVTDEDTGERYFADADAFRNAQLAAAKAKLEDLEKVWAWARLCDTREGQYFHRSDYNKTRSKKDGGAVVEIDYYGIVKVHEGLKKHAPAATNGAPASAPRPLYTAAQLTAARRLKSAVLQDAIAENPKVATVMACMGMLGARSATRIRVERKESHDYAAGNQTAKRLLRYAVELRDHLDGTKTDDVRRGDGQPLRSKSLHAMPGRDGDEADLYRALSDLSDEDLQTLFCGLVAATCGSFNANASPAAGDSLTALEIARDTGATMAERGRLDADYLHTCGKPLLGEIGLAAGAFDRKWWKKHRQKQTKAEIAETIMESEHRNPDFIPWDLRFAEPSEIAKQIPKPDDV